MRFENASLVYTSSALESRRRRRDRYEQALLQLARSVRLQPHAHQVKGRYVQHGELECVLMFVRSCLCNGERTHRAAHEGTLVDV